MSGGSSAATAGIRRFSVFGLIPKILLTAYVSVIGFSMGAGTAQAICCNCSPKSDPSKKACVTDTVQCSEIPLKQNNANLKDYTCVELTADQCKPVAAGGSALCSNEPTSADLYIPPGKAEDDATKVEVTPPTLGVSIPGLVFSKTISVIGGKLQESFLAQYIIAVYNYAVGIAVIAAAVMMVFGGFLYILGGTFESISKGKEYLTNALVGLILVLSIATILDTLNKRLTTFESVNVKLVSRESAFDDPKAEIERVRESSIVDDRPEEMPILINNKLIQPSTPATAPAAPSEQPTQPTPQQPTPGTPTPTVAPAVPVTPALPTPGTEQKNQKGEYVAQPGKCPEDMREIPYSPKYKLYDYSPVKPPTKSFCMDIYEAPNKQGVKPYSGVTNWEADYYCSQRGKRLCKLSEWQRACLGPTGKLRYSYGETFIPGPWVSAEHLLNPSDPKSTRGTSELKRSETTDKPAPCNYDQPPTMVLNERLLGFTSPSKFVPENSILNPNNPLLTSQEILTNIAAKTKNKEVASKIYDDLNTFLKGISLAEPSGHRPLCVSAEGIYDLTANVQEIVVKDNFADMPIEKRLAVSGMSVKNDKPYTWAGFYWTPIAHLDNVTAKPDCYKTWGSVHENQMRSYENGFRCCLDVADKPAE